MNIRGAIFDLDGTLTDSMYIWQKAPVDAHSPARWGTPLSVLALVLAAATLPVLGLLPHALAE